MEIKHLSTLLPKQNNCQFILTMYIKENVHKVQTYKTNKNNTHLSSLNIFCNSTSASLKGETKF